MSDAGIKNVIVKKSDLPEIYGIHQEYLVKYRIISDDKNRTSHWSPQHKLSVASVDSINYSMSVDQAANVIRLVWDNVSDVSNYDIYVKWDNQSWKYLTSVTTTSHSILIDSQASTVKFAIQVPTFPKERFSGLTLFETTSASV
jgi:hypothetical protein